MKDTLAIIIAVFGVICFIWLIGGITYAMGAPLYIAIPIVGVVTSIFVYKAFLDED